jgi:hypothetical protein
LTEVQKPAIVQPFFAIYSFSGKLLQKCIYFTTQRDFEPNEVRKDALSHAFSCNQPIKPVKTALSQPFA